MIRDVEGKELWLDGCNCGYGGVEPRGSESVLNWLVKNGRINLSSDKIREVFTERVINIFINDDNTAEVIGRESYVDSDDTGKVDAYYCDGRISG